VSLALGMHAFMPHELRPLHSPHGSPLLAKVGITSTPLLGHLRGRLRVSTGLTFCGARDAFGVCNAAQFIHLAGA
jgi:hypothetical protein